MTKIGIVIQARMGSSRFPGKVLADLNGKPVLQHVIDRCRQSFVKDIIVAIPRGDEQLYSWLLQQDVMSQDVMICRAPTDDDDDVLSRFVRASVKFNLDAIVRVCSDCPVLKPEHINRLVDEYTKHPVGYIAYKFSQGDWAGWPVVRSNVGMPELIASPTLHDLAVYALDIRQHVTWGAYESPPITKRFLSAAEDHAQKNTIDTPEDLERIAARCKSNLEAV